MSKTIDNLLKFGKKVIKPIAKPVLLTTALLLGPKVYSQTPTWYQAFNPRNEVVDGFDSYGMPDLNNNHNLRDDYNLIKGSLDPKADIDADGTPGIDNDLKVYTDYLNGDIEYLPGEYGRSTPSEKEAWIRKVYPIITRLNNREFIPVSDPRSQDPETRFDCTNGVIQDLLSINGYNPDRADFGLIHPKYTLEYNGLLNLPVYFAGVHSDDGVFNHAVTAIFTKTNLNDSDGWLFLEPQTGRVVEPGVDWSIPLNSEIRIQGLHNFKDAYNVGVMDEPRFYNAVKIHIDENGNREMDDADINSNMIMDQTTLGVEDNESTNVSEKYSLKNFPNPFNSNTTISYTTPQEGNVEINIFNIKGQKLETLVNENQFEGEHKVIWDAEKYPAGIYLYQLQTNNLTESKKMTSLK